MKHLFLCWSMLSLALPAAAEFPAVFAAQGVAIPGNAIDRKVEAALKARGLELAPLCADGVFLRRVHVDVTGTLPRLWEVDAFLKDKRKNKRALLVEKLLSRDEYSDYWALKWCDILRVKAEFPVNLWPNGVQAYHHWVREQVKNNRPLDQFARDLLTSSGSNFRTPPVNFYRAVQGRKPEVIAEATALTLLGQRTVDWPPEKQKKFALFFSKIGYKGTAEWKEEIIYHDLGKTEVLEAMFPDGKKVRIPAASDPRVVFADWLLAPENPCFAECMANRIWFWLFGRGVIEPVDDIRPDNPPANPELMAFLRDELIKNNFDFRALLRLILNSRTYQQVPNARQNDPEALALFACYPMRQMDAEVLADALKNLAGITPRYTSAIPEPFTFVPQRNSSVSLSDGSISSQFLEMFGRPSRDAGRADERSLAPNDAQRLFLLNSAEIQQGISGNRLLLRLAKKAEWEPLLVARRYYRLILARDPSPEEQTLVHQHIMARSDDRWQGTLDIAWALINSKEFLYRH